jgi:hypothetical protein
MPDSLLTYPYVLVRLRCDLCNRRGAYRLVRLALKFGPDITLDDLLRRLTADCAGRERNKRWDEGCRAYYPDLEPPVRPPDLAPKTATLRIVKK